VGRPRHACRPSEPAPVPTGRSRRRWLFGALAGLTLAASVIMPALRAGADTGTVTLDSVSGNGTGNLAVTITSAIPVGSITVHLMSGSTDTLVDPTDFSAQGNFSPGQPQIWTLNNASKNLANLAPGTYTATVDVTDADADQTVTGLTPTDPGANTFNFLAQPVVTFTQPSFNTTFPNEPTNITGQLSCSTLSCYAGSNWPSLPVIISDSYNTTWPTPPAAPASTAPNGSFSVQVSGIPNDTYTASVGATANTLAANHSGSIEDFATLATTSITAVATPASSGKQTITGTLTYQSGITQAAAPGGVTITATATGQQTIQATTAADGSFSMTSTPTKQQVVTGRTTWILTTQADTATNPFLGPTTKSVSETWPATLGGFSATLSKYYVLTVRGCLSSPITVPAPPPDDPAINIQYELSPAGPWRDVGTVSTMQTTGCAGAAFLAQGGAPAAGAYYRAYFPGDGTYQSATSASVRASLIATRFNPFGASAYTLASPRKNVTISGTLQYQARRWRAFAHQRVQLIFSRNGKTWYAYQWVRTNIQGNFSLTFADAVGTAYWSANYDGNATHLVAGAPEIKVTVRRHHTSLPVPGQAQPVTSFFATTASSGHSRGWPFLLAADPLLNLMGPPS
jgi:hypothetical protein